MNMHRLVNTKGAALFGSITLVLGVAVLNPFRHGSHAAGHVLVGTGRALSTQPLSCAQQTPMTLAIVGRVAPGHSAAELTAKGFGVVLALVRSEQDVLRQAATAPVPAAPQNSTGLVVIYPHTDASARGINLRDALASLSNNPALQAVGALQAQSNDPAYRSCDYRLSDSPDAQALVQPAAQAMIAQGYLTQAQLNDPGTILLLGDDPTQPTHKFVTVVLSRPVDTSNPAINPPASQSLTPVVASVDAATKSVLTVGYSNWYAGQ